MGNFGLGKASATSVSELRRSDIPDGRLWAPPAYYQTTGDAAVQFDSADDMIAVRIVPQTDFLIDAISRYVTAVATEGNGTPSICADSTAIEPNGDLNGSTTKCHANQTDNSTPLSVSATSEDGGGNNDAWKGFDGSTTTYWKSGADPAVTPQDYEIDFGVGNEKTINKVRITAANEADANNRCFPKTFTIQGHDGASYSTLSTVATSTDPGQALIAEYTFTNGTAMQKAKLNITDNHGSGAFVCVGEIEWIEAEEKPAPGSELQALGTLGSGDAADVWTRLAVESANRYQAQRGIPIWLVMAGADGADWSESIRRPNEAVGSAMPDEMQLCKISTDGGTTWTQALQNDLPAMWNMIVNSVESDHVPKLCYGRYQGRYCYLSGVGMMEIPEEGVALDCSALADGTEYYVYGYSDDDTTSGTFTLECSATAPTTSEGCEVKTGATTYRYLGIVVPRTLISTHQGPASCKDRRCVVNRYNWRYVPLGKDMIYHSNTSQGLTTLWQPWEAEGNFRVEFASDEKTIAYVTAKVHITPAASTSIYIAFGLDSIDSVAEGVVPSERYSNTSYGNLDITASFRAPLGLHFIEPIAKASTGTASSIYFYWSNVRHANIVGFMEA
jgi:hypothetical protein